MKRSVIGMPSGSRCLWPNGRKLTERRLSDPATGHRRSIPLAGSPLTRLPPLPNPHSAPPAPSGTTSTAPAPHAGHTSAWQSRVERSRSNRHRCPLARRGHAGTSSFCSGISPGAAARAPPPACGPGPPRPCRRRHRQPACRRPATGRRHRTPHTRAPREPPDPATGTPTTPTAAAAGPTPATRSRTARSSTPPEFRSCQPDVDVDRAIRLGRCAAPGTFSTARRTDVARPPTPNSSQPRTSPASSVERPAVRLGRRELGRARTAAAPRRPPSASGFRTATDARQSSGATSSVTLQLSPRVVWARQVPALPPGQPTSDAPFSPPARTRVRRGARRPEPCFQFWCRNSDVGGSGNSR